jgi:hypothetical protein
MVHCASELARSNSLRYPISGIILPFQRVSLEPSASSLTKIVRLRSDFDESRVTMVAVSVSSFVPPRRVSLPD